jgi:hypothetical protein
VRSLELPHGKPTLIPSLIDAVTMKGIGRLDSFEVNAERVIWVEDFYGVGKRVLGAILHSLSSSCEVVRVAYDPVESRAINGIFLEGSRVAILLCGKDGAREGKVINSKRFADIEALREVRGELRYAARLYNDCLDGALHGLAEVKVYHFLLEDIYKNAMDFNALNDFTYKFIGKLFI